MASVGGRGAELHEELDGRIQAVKAMYAQKTKALLSQISTLEDEVRILKLANKEHNRSKLIAALQQNAQERETVVEVLKSALVLASGRTRTEIDELVLRKTTGQPEKFKPRSREELAVEIATLRRQLESANVAVRRLESENASLARAKAAAGPVAKFGVDVLAPLSSGAGNSVATSVPQGAAPPLAPGQAGNGNMSLFGSSTSMLLGGAAAAGDSTMAGGEPDPVQTLKMALAAGSAIAAARQKASAAAASAGLSTVEQSSSSSAAAPASSRAGSAGHLRAAVAASRAQANQLFGGAEAAGAGAAAASSSSAPGSGAGADSAELLALRDRVAELTAIKDEQQSEIAEMHAQLQQMTALERRAVEIAGRYGSAKDSVEGTQRELERLSHEHAVALDELQRARSDLAQLRMSVAAGNAPPLPTLASAEPRPHDSGSNSSHQLHQQQQQLQRLEETVGNQHEEISRLRRQLAAQEDELATAKAAAAAAGAKSARSVDAEEAAELRRKLKKAEDEAASVRAELQDKVKQVEERGRREMEAQSDQLRRAEEDAKREARVAQARVKAVEDEMFLAQKEVAILRNALAASEAKVNAATSPGGPGGRRPGNTSPSASGAYGGFPPTTAAGSPAESEKQQQAEISSLKAALAAAQSEAAQAQTQATAIEAALSTREKELKTALQKLEAATAAQAAATAASSSAELDKVSAELSSARAANVELEADKERLGIEVEMLRDTVKSLTDTSEKRRLQIEVLTTQLAAAEAKASSSSSTAEQELAKAKEQLAEAQSAADSAKKEAAAAHKASEAAVKKADAAAKAAETAMREAKSEQAKRADFEKKYNDEKALREQREEWFASEKERADSDYESAIQSCEAAEKKAKAAEAHVDELRARVKELEAASSTAAGAAAGSGAPLASPSSPQGAGGRSARTASSSSPHKSLQAHESFQGGGTLTARISTNVSLTSTADGASVPAAPSTGRSDADKNSGSGNSSSPRSVTATDIQLKVGALMQERQAYACLAREAAMGMEAMMQSMVSTEARADALLKAVAGLLSEPAVAAAVEGPSHTNAAATRSMCLQAITVCEQRLNGGSPNSGGGGMREEVERLRGEEQSNIVTVTTCHAAMESLQSYVHALTFLLKQSGVEESDIPPAPPALLTLAKEMVAQLHTASASASPRNAGEGAPGFANNTGLNSASFSSPAKGASVFASGSLYAQLGSARAERNGYAALTRESARRLFALQSSVGNMSAKCDELEGRMQDVKANTTAATVTALCLQAIALCEQRVTDAAVHLQRLKAEESSNGVTVMAAHEAIESLQIYAATLAERLFSLSVPSYYIAPLGADVAAMAAADHFTRVPATPAVLPPPPLDLMALAETMVAELEFQQQSTEATAAAAAEAKKFLKISGLEDLTPPTPAAVSVQPSLSLGASYSASMPPSNVVSASPSAILPSHNIGYPSNVGPGPGATVAAADATTVTIAAPTAPKEPIAMRPMSASRHQRPESAGRVISRPTSASSALGGGGPSIPRPSSAVRRPPASASAHAAAVTSVIGGSAPAAAPQVAAAAPATSSSVPQPAVPRPTSTTYSRDADDDVDIPEDEDETPHIADNDEDEKDLPRATIRPKSNASTNAPAPAPAPVPEPVLAAPVAAEAQATPAPAAGGAPDVSPGKRGGRKKSPVKGGGAGAEGDDGIYEDEDWADESANSNADF